MAWALIADFVPLYPLYAVLFVERGLSGAEISALFAIWSAVGVAAEIPTGVLADRFSRRSSLVVGGILQALAYAAWTLHPEFAGFAAGFACWGIGGAFVSGASEALLYDGLAAHGASRDFPVVLGRFTAIGLVAQVPAAVAATVLVESELFGVGAFSLVGWASVGTCLGAAAVARTIPEPPQDPVAASDPAASPTLRAALREVRRGRAVAPALLGVAALTGLDAIEEYVPLLASQWAVPLPLIPLAGLGLPLAGALGAALGGRAARASGPALGLVVAVAGVLLLVAVLLAEPAALGAVFAFYALYQAAAVVAGARLQDRISGSARATVTSLASLGGEVTAFATYLAWAVAGGAGLAWLVLIVAVGVPFWLARSAGDRGGAQPGSQLTLPASSE